MHPIGPSDVQFNLDGKPAVLRATLNAALQLSRRDGGLMNTIRKIGLVDFDTIHAVVAAGIEKDAKELPELIFKTGINVVADAALTFVENLAKGPVPTKEDKAAAGESPLAKSA